MSIAELKEIKDIAKLFLKKKRSKEEILLSLQGAGIVTKAGKVKKPYDNIFSVKKLK